jgi:Virus neck protein
MTVQISFVDYYVPDLGEPVSSVFISFVDFHVPIVDQQGGVFITFCDLDLNSGLPAINLPSFTDIPFMATNPYFNSYSYAPEQNLVESLTVETIQIHGQDMYYVPRVVKNKDELYGADDISEYNTAYQIEMYVRSIEGFSGDGNFYSKFGLEIRDTIIFSVARRRFMDEIGYHENFPRPREGDLIFFPMNNKCFEIKFVDNKSIFYALGNLPVYDVHCELFEYSSETFNTGVPEIDSIQTSHSMDVADHSGNTNFATITTDPLHNNEDIETEADLIIDFSETDPFADGTY